MYKGISTYLRISQANVGKSHLKCPVTLNSKCSEYPIIGVITGPTCNVRIKRYCSSELSSLFLLSLQVRFSDFGLKAQQDAKCRA